MEDGLAGGPDWHAKRAIVEFLTGTFSPSDSVRLRRELEGAMHSVRNVGHAPGRFPVVIYGPSFNAPSFENATLMEYLASHGYIVISSPSMGAQGWMTPDVAGMESQARAPGRWFPGCCYRYPGAAPGNDGSAEEREAVAAQIAPFVSS